MTSTPPVVADPAPNELRGSGVRREVQRASIWLGLACAIALVVLLVQPLLIIFAGIVFASLLDGGVRLLGRVLPIGRGWRLLIVVLLVAAFLLGTFYLTGVQVTQQVMQLQSTLAVQVNRFTGWLSGMGIMPGASDVSGLLRQAMGSVGKLTSWVGTAIGALTSLFMIMIIGLFIAMDPGTYTRGMQWMVPTDLRPEFARTIQRMGDTLRRLLAGRLMGMAFEGVLTWVALAIGGVPTALLLGIIAGILAFIPNIGAIVTGVLMVAVGFSAGTDTGLWAIATYFVVQTFDGYVVVPMVAKRTVDLPPALTLGAQILSSALFGVMGLALADPMTAMIKAALERSSERAKASWVMTIVTLHDYWRSSAAYRVRIALNLKGVAYDTVPVDLVAGDQRGDANRAINPQGLVPTLVVDGIPLTQSLAILEWIDATWPEPPLIPRDPLAAAHARAQALVIAADIHPIDNLRVLKRLEAQFGADQAAKEDWYRHWVAEGFQALEAMMRGSGPFLGGATPGIADVCLVPQMYNARRFAVPLGVYPRLVAADAAAAALPAFAAAHPDRMNGR